MLVSGFNMDDEQKDIKRIKFGIGILKFEAHLMILEKPQFTLEP